MNQKTSSRRTARWVSGSVLRKVTGWALLAAAAGTFYDAAFCGGCSGGSIGLIPLYLGFPIGAIGLIWIFRRTEGWPPALIVAAGMAGILYFMFTYPAGANGWIGGILIGVGHLFLPLPGRFSAVLWVVTGILGFPEFGASSWGAIDAFTMFGIATAYSGAFVLVGQVEGT